MKNLKKIALASGMIATLGMAAAPVATAQPAPSGSLNPANQHQAKKDPIGAAAWGSFKTMVKLVQGTPFGAVSLASYYAQLDPNAAYLGYWEELNDRVKEEVGTDASRAERFNAARDILQADTQLKDDLLREAPAFA